MDRSNIDLLGNATSGVNLGSGESIFKCKDVTGNTLQFKTICATGSLSIITGDTELTFVGATGITVSGASNYVLKINNAGNNIEASSILDSGTTNIHICKNTVYLGDGTGSTCVTIKPSSPRKIEIIASSGVNIGSYSGNCLSIGATLDGLTLCSASYCDLLIHAGSCNLSGCTGKTLRLSGGDGAFDAAGGNVLITGGTGSVGGNVILSTSNSGRVQITNLPTSIQTNAVYVDGSGNLSKGTLSTGMTTIAGGTVNHIPVFNTAGNNIQNTTMTFISNVLCNNNNLTVEVPDLSSIYLNATDSTLGRCYGTVYLGKPTTNSIITGQKICPAGAATNIETWLTSKGSCPIYIYAPTVNLSNSGTLGFAFTSASRLFQLPMNAKICGYPGGNGASYCDATPICLIGGNGVNSSGWAGSGGTICVYAGNAGDGIGGTPKIGGNIIIKAGLGISGGADGRIQLCGLPPRAAETCGIYIDANGNLSKGLISGGSGGGTVGVTGATNGVCLYNSKNVCLGGSIVGNVALCASGLGNTLTFCSICGSCCGIISICCGGFSTCALNGSTGPAWSSCITNAGSITLTSYNGVCGNTVLIRPDAIYITQSGGAGNTGLQYTVCDYTKFNNLLAIPNVGWIKSYALGGWSNLTCGSTAAGCGVLASGITKNNTFFGVQAGKLTTGCNNVGVGTLTLTNNTSGCWNVALGYNALGANTTGCFNTAVGPNILISNTTGNFNVALGMNALHNNTSGNNNTAIGTNAMYCNTNSNDNIGIGFCALAANSIGQKNIAIGACALLLGTGNWNNIAIGLCALLTPTTASNNIAIGTETLTLDTSGSENIAIGLCSLRNNTGGQSNVAVGVMALKNNIVGNSNIAIGCAALQANTGGTFNIAIGTQALLANKGGNNNFAAGYNALYFNVNGNQNIAIGSGALSASINATNNIALGTNALKNNISGDGNIAQGYVTLQYNTTGSNNIALGHYALNCNTTGTYNVAIGHQAMWGIGSVITGSGNIGIGSIALNTIGSGSENIAFGTQSARYLNSGRCNISIGYCSSADNQMMDGNVAIGAWTLRRNTGGVCNIAIGYQSMQCAIGGHLNIAIGGNALYSATTGNYNIAIGRSALLSTNTGTENIAIGSGALSANKSGQSNVAIGCGALANAWTNSYNVAIGYNAGWNEVNSCRLHIANKAACSLIYGEFDNNYVKICGCLETSCAFKPATCPDAGMPINSIYFSTTSGKLAYKDSGGVVHDLY
jgi:hypothetical protein